MRDCQLAERGTHQQLMQLQGGYYQLVSCDAASQQEQQQQQQQKKKPEQKAADTAPVDGTAGTAQSPTIFAIYLSQLSWSSEPHFFLQQPYVTSTQTQPTYESNFSPCHVVLISENGTPGGRFTTDENYSSTAGTFKNFGIFCKVTYNVYVSITFTVLHAVVIQNASQT